MSAVSFRRRRSVSARSTVLFVTVLSVFVSMPVLAQCDPAGVRRPWFPAALAPIEHELFKNELAARGLCARSSANASIGDQPQALLEEVEREAAGPRCDGVCEPMRQKLAPLGEAHDLEDLTFQKECSAAAASLPKEAQPSCLRVCVVERRRLGAKAVWARLVRLLERSLPDQARGLALSSVRAALRQQGLGVPPSSIRLEVGGDEAEPHVRAEGWLYPGGPRVRLRTALMSAGCGLMAWGVTTW